MPSCSDLLQAVDKLEWIQSQIEISSKRSDHERKIEIVNLRRQLSEQIGHVNAIGRTLVEQPKYRGLAVEFRRRLSVMRSAIALHQASWPAVTLDDVDDSYRQSVALVRKERSEFIAWTRVNFTV